MSSFSVECPCGQQFHVDDSVVGRRLRCRRCSRITEVRRPATRPAARSTPSTAAPAKLVTKPAPSPPARPTPARPSAPAGNTQATHGADDAGFFADLGDTLADWRDDIVDGFRGWQSRTISRARRDNRLGARANMALIISAWAYLAAAVGIAMVMWLYGDEWWPGTFLLFMGRWVFLLPLVALVPAMATWRRSLLIPVTLGALVVLGPVMGGRVGWRRLLPMPAGMPLRIVTFNADGGMTIQPRLPYLLEQWDADVVLLQECADQLAETTEHMDGWKWHHIPGLCLLTRLPILKAEQMDRSVLERVKQDAAESIGGAGYVVRYTLKSPAGPISVTNLHLETPRKGLEAIASRNLLASTTSRNLARLGSNTELRDIESTLARRWVDAGHGPTIVAGDFNTPVESRIFQDHWGTLHDVFSRIGTGFGMTKFNGWISVRIDHVLTDDAWRAAHVFRWRNLGSDHLPLVVDLVLVGR